NVGQAKIEDDEVGLLREQRQRGLAVRRIEDLVTLRAQPHAQQLADRRLVVDHQHLDWSGAHAAVSSTLTSAGAGRRIENTAPRRSTRLAASIVPCIASTKPREIASPSPVPART